MRLVLAVPLLAGCMHLHHVQLGEIDNTSELGARRFDVEVMVGGLDEEAVIAEVASSFSTIFSYGSMGPRTGIPRRRGSLSADIHDKVYEACPSGEVTGVTSRRETLQVPFGGVEILRVTGYCIVRS